MSNFQAYVVVFVSAVSLSACRLSANFHTVDKGQFYRSAQLTEGELIQAIDKLGIKTVINLRGAAPGSGWYDREAAVLADRAGEASAIYQIEYMGKTKKHCGSLGPQPEVEQEREIAL